MSFSNLLKQLKKKLRRKRRLLSLGALLLAAGVTASASASVLDQTGFIGDRSASRSVAVWAAVPGKAERERIADEANKRALETMRQETDRRMGYHQKRYVCGEELAELGRMDAEQAEAYQREHPGTVLMLGDKGELYFVEDIEDLSEQCKETAYFGIDRNSNLSLFDGLPAREQVIRTFFQLNVEHLKSSLPSETINQLYSGIRVSDIEEYNSVISTFSDFAVAAGKE
ncbi:hypothetical protein J31TS4_24980 [Paenibacillus sp. J31TS4]|uniref:BofC C-terminal domain-containing protein n=1 Tax=Paenibacillus sp. J31TS4 TaxID=2807195 RepID=UPI001B0F12F3|nr:BofC C-terminal domain-containing protein [Paenibacillus sp. J31TS4]GIP39218.1 hypothetical protein J31TS4_24980 [Paenibacillus sp. J31TS4]